MQIEFTIPGEPVPQARPRASRQGNRVVMYDPPKSRNYKKYVELIARQYAPKKLYEGELEMEIKIYRPIPKSTTKKNRALKNAGIKRPIVKPDNSNYAKGIEDALNGIIYKDDSQIVDLKISKFYSDDPRVEVKIRELELMELIK